MSPFKTVQKSIMNNADKIGDYAPKGCDLVVDGVVENYEVSG